jgi:uncharacterized RDD family membrane protein YckC
LENLATLRKRILGGLIDHALVMVLTIWYVTAFGHPNEDGGQSVEGLQSLPVFLFWFIYFPLSEGLGGQTLGKRIMGTRVIRQSGARIGIGNAFLRHLFDVLDVSFAVGVLIISNTPLKQRIGDLIAKTIVIEDKFVLCENCKADLELTASEFRIGRFYCPKCGYENTIKK